MRPRPGRQSRESIAFCNPTRRAAGLVLALPCTGLAKGDEDEKSGQRKFTVQLQLSFRFRFVVSRIVAAASSKLPSFAAGSDRAVIGTHGAVFQRRQRKRARTTRATPGCECPPPPPITR